MRRHTDASIVKITSLEAKVDIIQSDVSQLKEETKSLNKILAVNTESLKEHIEGVRLAREQNEIMKAELDAKIEPLQKHVSQVNFLGKLLLVFLAFPAAFYYTIKVVLILAGKI